MGSQQVLAFLTTSPDASPTTVREVIRNINAHVEANPSGYPKPQDPYQRKVWEYGRRMDTLFEQDLKRLSSANPAAGGSKADGAAAKGKKREGT